MTPATKRPQTYALLDRAATGIGYRLQIANYFPLSLDSTQAVTHVDQLIFVVRCSQNTVEKSDFCSSFPFMNIKQIVLLMLVLDFKTQHSLMNRGGQSYDNAANMPGHYRALHDNVE
jgi:hypothetical protein